jgi:hypothetical protein
MQGEILGTIWNEIFYSNFDKYPGWLSDLLFFWKMPSNHTLLEPEQQYLLTPVSWHHRL